MVKKMLINATHPEEYRVAIVEDGVLSEFDIEVAGHESTRGNIYKGVVVRVESGLQAAFIDFGAERMGFLQMGEIHPSFFRAWREKTGDKGGRPRITDLFHRGQEILVQIVKEERGTKGAALTTYLSLAGRFMVLMPDSDTRGISRKIEEESTRKKLKQAMNSLDLPVQTGYIVRTAAIGQKKEELKRDFNYLQSLFQNIQTLSSQVKAPALVYRESNLIIRSIRDYFTPDMDEVLVDDPRVFDEARTFFQEVMPEFARLVKLHQERRPIFNRYQIEEQIETISKNRVSLPSGGSIVIDATEALVAIDVNSGKLATEQGVEGTATRTNLEAAEEVARQLRLRDLGGLIVVDFIDMRDRKNVRAVEKCLRDALRRDKARTTVGRISQFGLLEMSRQRIKSVLAEATFRFCPTCHGTGKVKSPEAQAVAFLRRLHAGVAKNQISRAEGEVPLDVANYLLNSKRDELLELEKRHHVTIQIQGRPDLGAGETELHLHKRDSEISAVEPAVNEPVSPENRSAEPQPEPPPQAQSTKVEKEESAADQSAESEPKTRKRPRRRHRGKKKERTESVAAPQETQSTGEKSSEGQSGGGPESKPSRDDGSPADAAAEAKPHVPDAPKPRRKRPHTKNKTATAESKPSPAPPSEANQKAGDAGIPSSGAASSPTNPDRPVDPEGPVEPKPAEQAAPPPPKKRSRRSRRKDVSETTSEDVSGPASGVVAPPVKETQPPESPPEDPKPKKRTSRPRKKKSTPSDAGAMSSAAAEPAQTTEEKQSARKTRAASNPDHTDVAKPAPRRRRGPTVRKTKVESKPAEPETPGE